MIATVSMLLLMDYNHGRDYTLPRENITQSGLLSFVQTLKCTIAALHVRAFLRTYTWTPVDRNPPNCLLTYAPHC